jgi:hypothetical protein
MYFALWDNRRALPGEPDVSTTPAWQVAMKTSRLQDLSTRQDHGNVWNKIQVVYDDLTSAQPLLLGGEQGQPAPVRYP